MGGPGGLELILINKEDDIMINFVDVCALYYRLGANGVLYFVFVIRSKSAIKRNLVILFLLLKQEENKGRKGFIT